MQIERVILRVKDTLCWICFAAILVGIIYAACTGQRTRTPGEIIYEKTHEKARIDTAVSSVFAIFTQRLQI